MDIVEIENEFNAFWTSNKDSFVLVKWFNQFGYLIIDRHSLGMVIIEDGEAAKYVIKKMLENGVTVFDDFDEVINQNIN